MSLHHVIKSLDLDPLEKVCVYCGETCDGEWESEWHGEHHYKVCHCEHCGRDSFKGVEFHGSGHDDFSS